MALTVRSINIFRNDAPDGQQYFLLTLTRGCSHLMICVYILIFGRRSGCFGWY